MQNILEQRLATELDLSAARQRTRQIAAACGFGLHEQTRLATTVSELARAAIDGRRTGHVTFLLAQEGAGQVLVVRLANVVDPDAPGAASGLVAAHRFMDLVETDPAANGVVLYKRCPRKAAALDADAIELAIGSLGLQNGAALAQAQQRSADLESRNDDFALLNGQLSTRAESLLSADRRKDEFLAILAHELRGPLSALAMAGAVLEKNAADPERVVRLGQMIVRQSAHMNRIVEDLLDVSRIVRNEVVIERRALDLREPITVAVEQLTAAAQRRRHDVAVRLPDYPVVVQGDRTRLIQVIANLIGNAVRYTPEGGRIEVELGLRDEHACLNVADNGIGISAALLPTLFDLFVQAERSTDARNSGLGLGLALVKTLVEAHGGRVTVHSDGPGRGSRFGICLPLSQESPCGAAQPEAVPAA